MAQVQARFRAALIAREAKTVAAVQAAIDVAEQPVRESLTAIMAQIAAAELANTPLDDQWLYAEARYQALIQQLDAWRDEIADNAAPLVQSAQSDYVAQADGTAEALATAAAGSLPSGVTADLPWNTLPRERLTALIGSMSDGSPLHDYLHQVGGEQAQAVKDALVHGITMGRGSDRIRRDVETALGGQSARAQNIARTEPMRAAREAQRRTFEQNSVANGGVVTGVVWSSAMDDRTCASCWAMQGTVLAPGDVVDDHNCGRCVGLPQTQSWAEITGDDSLPDNRPVIESGADVFAGLSDERQRGILGPGLYGLYASGVPLSAMSTQDDNGRWGTMRRVSTIAEATANAGK